MPDPQFPHQRKIFLKHFFRLLNVESLLYILQLALYYDCVILLHLCILRNIHGYFIIPLDTENVHIIPVSDIQLPNRLFLPVHRYFHLKDTIVFIDLHIVSNVV